MNSSLLTLLALASLLLPGPAIAQEPDRCARMAQEIQGKKHGFLAGNVTYYVGGFHASWNPIEEETLGLTHPFHHDLRSRGVGLVESEIAGTEHTGVGNDYLGREFYKDTRVLYGSVIVNGEVHEHPKPVRMFWRPDQMICEYEVAGVTLREEKFIGANDAAASIITSSEPVMLRFDGHSFFVRESVASTAQSRFDPARNSIVLLFLEGLAGIRYSIPDQSFHVREAMPKSWDWMEVDVPIRKGEWTRVRIERAAGEKTITVEGSPFPVTLEAWTEGTLDDAPPHLIGEEAATIARRNPTIPAHNFPRSVRRHHFQFDCLSESPSGTGALRPDWADRGDKGCFPSTCGRVP